MSDPHFARSGVELKKLGVVTALGFASGLPLALSDSTLQAWLTVDGQNLVTIGFISLVGLPYVFKFLWAPLLDHFRLGRIGRRRSWMLTTQLLLAASLSLMAVLTPANELTLIATIALLIAFLSATQDIAIDAYRTEILSPEQRGLGVGLSVAAYRLALIATGAGALIFADRFGFNRAYLVFALLMGVGVCASLVGDEPPVDNTPMSLSEAVVLPFVEFWRRPGALFFLILIVSYKLGDAFAAKLTTTFFLRELNFSLTEVGAFYKTAGLVAAIVGGIAGGALMYRLSLYRALIWFAILQMLTNVGFVILTLTGKAYVVMIVVVILENLFGGMGTAAYIALIMALCDQRFTATQFALLTAIASLGRVFTGPFTGVMVESIGWLNFFLFSVAVAAIPVFLVRGMRQSIFRLERNQIKLNGAD